MAEMTNMWREPPRLSQALTGAPTATGETACKPLCRAEGVLAATGTAAMSSDPHRPLWELLRPPARRPATACAGRYGPGSPWHCREIPRLCAKWERLMDGEWSA